MGSLKFACCPTKTTANVVQIEVINSRLELKGITKIIFLNIRVSWYLCYLPHQMRIATTMYSIMLATYMFRNFPTVWTIAKYWSIINKTKKVQLCCNLQLANDYIHIWLVWWLHFSWPANGFLNLFPCWAHSMLCFFSSST